MRAWLRSRGLSFATRYHEGLSRSDKAPPASGQERPELQAQPVNGAARPDPGEVALLNLDLADAGHARAQPAGAGVQARLDAKHVAALLRQVDRDNRGDGESEGLAGHRRHRELAALSHGDVADV